MEFKTERLLLRPLDISDLQTVNQYATDVLNTQYMMHLPSRNEEETKQFLLGVSAEWKKEAPSFYEFAIVLHSTQIGAVSVYLNETRTEGELGWILNKKYWGNGYVTEAALKVKEFAIQSLQLKKLTAHCDCRNKSSARVMEKIGLALESKGEREYPDARGYASEYKYSSENVNPVFEKR
jgi:RimJ/RimL family protein N-acetyltransferase